MQPIAGFFVIGGALFFSTVNACYPTIWPKFLIVAVESKVSLFFIDKQRSPQIESQIPITKPLRNWRTFRMAQVFKVAVLPGDGIGPEVMAEALRVLDAVESKYSPVRTDAGQRGRRRYR